MKHVRSPINGASFQIDYERRPNGVMLILMQNGDYVERLVTGSDCEAAIAAYEAFDVISFGEIMFPEPLKAEARAA